MAKFQPSKHIEPRLLTKKQASQYCGVSESIFDQVIDVQPIELEEGRDRLRRFDIIDLNKWIESRKGHSLEPENNIDDLIGALGG